MNTQRFVDLRVDEVFFNKLLAKTSEQEGFTFWSPRKKISYENYKVYSFVPLKLLFWPSIIDYSESFWYAATRVIKARRKKVYFTKCSNRTLTLSG